MMGGGRLVSTSRSLEDAAQTRFISWLHKLGGAGELIPVFPVPSRYSAGIRGCLFGEVVPPDWRTSGSDGGIKWGQGR